MTEGTFPKIDGDIWYASEVNNMVLNYNKSNSLILDNSYYTARASNGSLLTDFFTEDSALTKTGLTYRSLSSKGTAGSGEYYKATSGAFTFQTYNYLTDANTNMVENHVDYEVWTVYDECDNSVVGATWTTAGAGTATEDTTALILSGVKTATTNDLSSLGVIKTAGVIKNSTAGGGSLILTDGTNTSTLLALGATSFAAQPTGQLEFEVKLFTDWTNKKLIADISYFSVTTTGANFGSTYDTTVIPMKIHLTKFVNLTGWTSLKIRYSNSSGSTYCHYVRTSKVNPTTTTTIQVSNDGASNWTTTESGAIQRLSTASNSLSMKITGTVGTNEVFVLRSVSFGGKKTV